MQDIIAVESLYVGNSQVRIVIGFDDCFEKKTSLA